ncbi:MAG: hypothetical protein ACRC10_02100 [Thermoguttaceae bacterium]
MNSQHLVVKQDNPVAAQQPGPTRSFWDGWKRRLLIVFYIHLIPVFLISYGVYYALRHDLTSDAQVLWLLLYVIDSPIGLFALPYYLVVESIQEKMSIGGILLSFPAVFQFLGTINWFLAVSVLRTYARRSEKGRVPVILGVLSLFFLFCPYISLILGIAGLVYGIRFRSKMGVGLNVAGLILSLLGLFLLLYF